MNESNIILCQLGGGRYHPCVLELTAYFSNLTRGAEGGREGGREGGFATPDAAAPSQRASSKFEIFSCLGEVWIIRVHLHSELLGDRRCSSSLAFVLVHSPARLELKNSLGFILHRAQPTRQG